MQPEGFKPENRQAPVNAYADIFCGRAGGHGPGPLGLADSDAGRRKLDSRILNLRVSNLKPPGSCICRGNCIHIHILHIQVLY
jgi:hypothetical protein